MRGFTLIEILVAITILAMVGTMTWSAFSQTARNKARIEAEADRYHQIRSALDLMQREISMAFVSAQRNPSATLQVYETGFVGTDRSGRDRLDFTSFSHQRLYRNAHESDQNEISYFVTQHPDRGTGLVLARREQNRLDDEPTRGGRVQILVEELEELDLQYLDPLSQDWVDSWDARPTGAHANRLPSQVRIAITVPDPHDQRGSETFATRANVQITWAVNHAIYNP